MTDYRKKRLYSPKNKLKKIMADLDPDLLEYFEDIRKPKKLKKKSKSAPRFFIGDIVTVGQSHGTVIYGPYQSDSDRETYEVELEDGEIITVEDDGKKIVKYSRLNQDEDIEE